MYVLTVNQTQLAAAVNGAIDKLNPHEVAHVAYRIGTDSTGQASIFFRITLQDWAVTEATITLISSRVATKLFEEVRPIENWGLHPYFNFRSVSEQANRPDPDWI